MMKKYSLASGLIFHGKYNTLFEIFSIGAKFGKRIISFSLTVLASLNTKERILLVYTCEITYN